MRDKTRADAKATADDTTPTRAPGGGDALATRALAAVLSGMARALRKAYPTDLIERRCPECRRLLCRAEVDACVEIVCPRCKGVVQFPQEH